MDGEPELPTLPKPSTTYPIRNPWKRVRQSSPAASSSDAVFSSDDNPSADNYCQSRRKKLYRGPWYAHHRMGETAEPKQPVQAGKRTLRRQYDSGVWMGSDISSSDEAVLHPQAPALSPGTASKHRHLITEHQQPSVSPEVAAIKVVTNCVENCDENVDLS